MILSVHFDLSIAEHDALFAARRDGQRCSIGEAPLLAHVLVLGVEVADAAVGQPDLRGTVFVTLLYLATGKD